MTPLFWIALTWVLATIMVARLPLGQRFVPGALLALAALPILVSIFLQLGPLGALLGAGAALSLFPNTLRLAQARWRGERVRIDANVLRFLLVPDAL